MFEEVDGPTALRSSSVRALCYSRRLERVTESGFEGSCCAAISAVWNGKRGYVAILVRQLEPALLRRYVAQGSCRSESALRETLEEALAFVGALGFSMDSHEFADLSPDERDDRLEEWNALRKLDRQPRCFVVGEPAEPASSAAPEEEEAGKAVLGRLALVRRGSERLDPIVRLLSYL